MGKKPHLELVTWTDHTFHAGDNPNLDAPLVTRKSVGWVVRDNRALLALAHTLDTDGHSDVLVIAKPLITRRRKLR